MHQDRATQFTLDFLNAVEKKLHIEWTEQGDPVFITDAVNEFSIAGLRRELGDLYGSSALDGAVGDMESCFREHKVLQSTGVGLADDFDLFAKLGLLLGDRLVLWDAVLQAMFQAGDEAIDRVELGQVVCELLRLKKVAAQGGVVLLPHPTNWLERSRYYYARVLQAGDVGSDFLGFINARALLDEGIDVHPYALSRSRARSAALQSAVIGGAETMKPEAVEYHELLAELMRDEQFVFLRGVSIERFHELLGDRQYRLELRTELAAFPAGMSEAEKSVTAGEIRKKLKAAIDQQNRDLILKMVGLGGAAAGAVGATVAVLADAAAQAAFLTLMTGTLGTISNWAPLLERLFSKTKKPTLYQVFRRLEVEAEQEELKRQSERWSNVESYTEAGRV